MSDEIQINVWTKRGDMMVNTSSLSYDDPEHPYNQIKNLGKNPEDFGYFNPKYDEFKNKTKLDLIDEILSLREELLFYVRN